MPPRSSSRSPMSGRIAAPPPALERGPRGVFQTGYTWGGRSEHAAERRRHSAIGDPRYLHPHGRRDGCALSDRTAFDTVETRWSDAPSAPARARAILLRRSVERRIHPGARRRNAALSINLGGTWADNFTMMPTPWPANSFAPTNNVAFAQACISAAAALTDGGGNPLVNFSRCRASSWSSVRRHRDDR